MSDRLVRFLSGEEPDDQGRYITEIVAWSDYRLESCHDYIQWVFPNRTASRFNPEAPTLDQQSIKAITENPAALLNFRSSLFRMYRFYSFAIVRFHDGTYQLDFSQKPRESHWLRPGNHNLLRLSRILLSVKALQLTDDFDALRDLLDLISRKHHALLGDETVRYWQSIFNTTDC